MSHISCSMFKNEYGPPSLPKALDLLLIKVVVARIMEVMEIVMVIVLITTIIIVIVI